ncbi:MAG: S8 family serine peptidase [Acidobacteria bacterium]|nr:S8 family serine peptidase [Acidobacteriota bacterium]
MPVPPTAHAPVAMGTEAGLTLVLKTESGRDACEAFLAAHHLRSEWRAPSLRLCVRGRVDDLGAAFGLRWVEASSGHLVAQGEVTLPPDLHSILRGVMGLDERPRMRPHLRAKAFAETAAPEGEGCFATDFAARYGFPPGNGAGQHVGLLQLGGAVAQSDLAAYFGALGLKVPEMVLVPVSGGDPNPAKDPRWEMTLDVEVLGAIVPGAKLSIFVAPNSADGLLDLVEAALKGGPDQPTVLSMSWGAAESAWGALELELVSDAFQAAAGLGVTVLVSSGDEGSADGATDGKQHVNFPASSPWVLGVGGTQRWDAKEIVWNALAEQKGATGGGVSDYFELPDWQKDVAVPKSANDGAVRRGVPDLAAHAAEAGGYRVFVDGQWRVLGGTSAAAPLLAGLVARINATRPKPLGYLNPALYGAAKTALTPITEGGNGAYAATEGYSACTGLGVPDGAALLKALT